VGPDWPLMGWGKGTNIARMGLTHHNMTFVKPAHPEFRKFEVDQFVQIVKDSADGSSSTRPALLAWWISTPIFALLLIAHCQKGS
jgi:hypothetical protein